MIIKLLIILILNILPEYLVLDCNNPLLDVFNFTRLSTPLKGDTLPYCLNLQISQTCCSNETVEHFQVSLDYLANELQKLAQEKDIYLSQLHANLTEKFQKVNSKLQDFLDDIFDIVKNDPNVGNPIQSEFYLFQSFSSKLKVIGDSFDQSLQSYQQAREKCFNAILQIQASAWCLACDPMYEMQGVKSDGTVNASAEVCNKIQNNCANYVYQSNSLNPLYQAQQAYQRLNDLVSYLSEYRNYNNQISPIPLDYFKFHPTDPIQQTNSISPRCNATNCTWLCSNIFSPQFVLNMTLLAYGSGMIGKDDLNLQPIGVLAKDTNEKVEKQDDLLESVSTTILLQKESEKTLQGSTTINNENTSLFDSEFLILSNWNPDFASNNLNIKIAFGSRKTRK